MVRLRRVTIRTNKGQIITIGDITSQELAAKYVPDFEKKIHLDMEIPRDPQDFYDSFGHFDHDFERDPITKLPTKVTELTWYQYQFAQLDFGLSLKSNKVGMTSSELLGDFQTRLLPESAGFTCLIAAPKLEIANDLVMKLKKWIADSPRYSKFLVKRPDFEDFKEEKSKIGTIRPLA